MPVGHAAGSLMPRSPLSSLLRLLGALALLGLPPQLATAATVYHSPSDDGAPGSAQIGTGTQSVYLYIDGGPGASVPGSACDDGSGDEVCGYDLELDAAGGLTLSGFVPDPGADLLVNLAGGSLRVNGLDTQAPTPGPQRIGELVVSGAAGATLELASGEVVGANLSSEALAASTLVSVPEAALLPGLGAGILLLAGLARRRSAR